jgi:uncharacterized protein
MNAFLNSQNELRSGWKFTTYVLFFLLIWIATGALASAVYNAANPPEGELTLLVVNGIVLFVPAVAALLLTVHFADHRPLKAFGIGFVPGWQPQLATGLGMAAVMLAVLVAGCYAVGYVRMSWSGTQVSGGTLATTLILLLVAAANEELVFRGFPLQILVEGVGEWPAIIALSGLFGMLHFQNPNASLLGTANTVIAGIMLSLAYVRTRSLWLPYGIHVGWNVGLGFILGFPLSGVDIASLWTTGIAGSDTILGGGYGPEGGLLATFVFGASALLVNKKYGSVHRT